MMRQQEILKKIGGIIAELKDQYTYLETAGSDFNELELELFMANAHFLTDHIGILQKINQQPITSESAAAKPVLQLEETPIKPVIPDYFDEQDLLSVAESNQTEKDAIKTVEPTSPVLPFAEAIILPEVMLQNDVDLTSQKINDLPEATPETGYVGDNNQDASFINPNLETENLEEKSFEPNDKIALEHLETDAAFIDPKLENSDLQEEHFELNPVITQPAARPETLLMNTQQSAASDFNISSGSETRNVAEPAVLTLNDRIAAQKDADQLKTRSDQPKSNQDLQAMISLNDKLLFVKELFNGYNLAYAEAINILNRYTSFEQAENFLNINYAVKNSWKDKPVTTEKFMDLLRKKLG